ncbi:MAG: DNA replication complex subunit Gins51 [Candidatus Odinarchaeia archaeon]
MYNELYNLWVKEKETDDLLDITSDFFEKIKTYIKTLEELTSSNLDIQRKIAEIELKNVKFMVLDLLKTRLTKKILTESFSTEEIEYKLLSTLSGVLKSKAPSVHEELKEPETTCVKTAEEEDKPKYLIVRLLQAIPAIVGEDLKIYGPFKPEDVAVLPAGNAKALINRGVAVEIKQSNEKKLNAQTS